MKRPILFGFIIEGVGPVDVYANSYSEAHAKCSDRVGFPIYGKGILEFECCDNNKVIRNWRT